VRSLPSSVSVRFGDDNTLACAAKFASRLRVLLYVYVPYTPVLHRARGAVSNEHIKNEICTRVSLHVSRVLIGCCVYEVVVHEDGKEHIPTDTILVSNNVRDIKNEFAL